MDRIEYLDAFTQEEPGPRGRGHDIARDHPATPSEKLTSSPPRSAETASAQRCRRSRKWEEQRPAAQARHRAAAAGGGQPVGGRTGLDAFLDGRARPVHGLVVVYAVNRAAARQLLGMGVTRFGAVAGGRAGELCGRCSPSSGPKAVLIVYQDTPMFVAESCAYANLIGGCPGKANCSFESMDMVSSHGR
ncbi:MAG: hypothetical protein U0797_21860 [Gemmataceae bacterium]